MSARLDALLHDVIRYVSACGNPRIQGLPEYYDCSYARWSTSTNSRLERGPELRGERTKWSRRGWFSVQGTVPAETPSDLIPQARKIEFESCK